MLLSRKKKSPDIKNVSLEQILLLEQLSSRICHDLISPVGAVHNGLELLEEMGPDTMEDALGLMRHSIDQATCKLKAYRLAFGAGGRDPSIKPGDVYDIADKYFRLENKIVQNWSPVDIQFDETPAALCKIMMSGILVLSECLPKGGTIDVEQDGRTLEMSASGENAAFRETIEQTLAGNIDAHEIDPRLITAFIFGMTCRCFSVALTTESHNGKVSLTLTF